MSDVSAAAGVSRGTAYRYFGSVEALLVELGRREVEHFEACVREAMAGPVEERLGRGLEFAAAFAGSHPLLERLPHTDPALVLDSLRERFPEIRASFERLFAHPFAATPAVLTGLLSTDQLVDWTARLFVSLFLFPGAEPAEIARGLGALHRLAAGEQPTADQE
jgi:AcrR family transcriptional regulator